MIHVTFCSSGAGSLRQALRIRGQRQRVVDLTDDLSWGPIGYGDFLERKEWLNSSLPWEQNSRFGAGDWDWIASAAQDFQRKLERSDEHLVWVAPQNAGELCGLNWYLHHFDGDKATFILVEYGFPGTWEGRAPGSIGELGPAQFQYLLENADPVAWDERRFPRDHWDQLCDEATNLRIVHEGAATAVADDYFDEIILEKCSEKWRKLHRVVAEAVVAIWDAEHRTSDNFIVWRLRELTRRGQVVANRSITVDCHNPDDPVLVRLG